MSYTLVQVFVPAIRCDKCWRKLTKDDENRFFNSDEDISKAADDMGWHRYDQPGVDPRHVCPDCAEKAVM